MSGSVFELNLDAPLKTGDSNLKLSKQHHDGVMEDLHRAGQELVPSFAHASPGMRESYANATKELSDLSIIGLANAGSRFGNNNDAINKFFNGNGGQSEEAAAQTDGGFENFLNGRSEVAATHIQPKRLNSTYANG